MNETLPPITPTEGSSGEWANLAPGAYRAVLDNIEDVGVSMLYPADGPRFEMTFALMDARDSDGNAITMKRWCSQKLTTGKMQSNLWSWAVALGLPPVVGQPFSPSQLMGRECQVVIEIKQKQDGTSRPQIGSILPPMAAPAATAQAARGPIGAAAAAGDVCKVAGCGLAVVTYTPRGTPLCGTHTAEDLG